MSRTFFSRRCTTPKEISHHVRRLLKQVGAQQDPLFVRVEASPGATIAECHANVKLHVNKYGGDAILGWLIWEWPGKLIEAQLHSIYRSETGHYVDITPQPDGETEILFCPDNNFNYVGVQPDNVRLILSHDSQTLHAIRIAEARHRLHLKYATHGGGSRIPVDEMLKAIEESTRRNDPCPCGSGKKFKACCITATNATRYRLWLYE
jgi:hypothetical protein